MENLAGAAEVREVEGDHVDARERLAELPDPRVVRSVAPPDEKRPLVEPQRVAALRGRGLVEAGGDGNARRREVLRERRDLDSARLLARTKEHGAVSAEEGRVMD